MKLLNQFQGVVYSFVYSILFSFLYSFINRLFFKYKKNILRYLLQICIGIIFGVTYYYGLLIINHGILRLYYFVGLVMGYIIYENYYAFYMLLWLEKVMKIIKKLLSPIIFIFQKFHGILKAVKKKVKLWHRKKAEEQDSS
jgi:hypothetical protein